MYQQKTGRASNRSRLPRFGIKGLLIAVAIVASWLATFRVPTDGNDHAGIQLRLTIILGSCLAAGIAALYFRGKRQAFWVGFAATLSLLFTKPGAWTPDLWGVALVWGSMLSQAFQLTQAQQRFIEYNIWAGLLLTASTIVGLVASAIYARSQAKE
jgi:hypothetical protein